MTARPKIIVVLAAMAVMALLGPARLSAAADAEPLQVAVSITPQAWLVKEIGGDRVDVNVVVPPGESPATYAPSDEQVSRVMKARLYFRIGVPFERGAWFRAIEQSRRLRIVDQRHGITMREMEHHDHADHAPGHAHDHDHAHDNQDPHIWLTPRLLETQSLTVTKALAEADPTHRDDYERRRRDLAGRLRTLDAAIREILDPVKGGVFFVFHPAWGYFADEYGLSQQSIEIEGKTPADHELTEIQRRARREGVRVVFVQPQIAGRAARAVAEAIGGRLETLDPLAEDVPGNLEHVARRLAASLDRDRQAGATP